MADPSGHECLVDFLHLGLIQTTLDARLAWVPNGNAPKISKAQDAHAWREIRRAMRSFQDGDNRPRIIVLPELSLPRTRLNDFEQLVASLNLIAIVGVDYKLDRSLRQAQNEGIIFIPSGFWNDKPSKRCARVAFGKSHPAPSEKSAIAGLKPPWSFVGDPNVYIFDCEKYGKFGVSICYDFMDLERALMYRGKVHHLFVLAYNRDLEMFRSLANSLSRTTYCNVVICNTGFHGGSIVVSPYYEAYRRVLYSHDGQGLFTTQVISVPVADLQKSLAGGCTKSVVKQEIRLFKDPPPGVALHPPLTPKVVSLK